MIIWLNGTFGAGKTTTAKHLAGRLDNARIFDACRVVLAICLLACIYLAAAAAVQRQHDANTDADTGLIPFTVLELLRLLRGTVITPPRRDRPHRLRWSFWRRRSCLLCASCPGPDAATAAYAALRHPTEQGVSCGPRRRRHPASPMSGLMVAE